MAASGSAALATGTAIHDQAPVATPLVAGKAGGKPSFFAPLRDDVDLLPGPHQDDGSPTWLLHDPVTNRFVQIGWQECEILRRWPRGSVAAIVEAVNRETTLRIDAADVDMIGRFLDSQQMLRSITVEDMHKRLQAVKRQHGGLFKVLLSHYLFFRVPLLRPDRFLANTMWLVRPLFTPAFGAVVLGGALLAFFLVMRQWDVFIRTTVQFLTWDSLAYYLVAIFVAKCFHELGHAYCCKLYGLNVPVIGIAFLVFWPFLYTDTGESWKLRSRKQRFVIGAAGMLAELTLAVAATLAWSVMPPGAPRTCAFFLATSSWMITLAVNLSPFMRWDGYYLLSDGTGINNLQPRAHAMARWRLREWLFGFGDPQPEDLGRGRNLFLIAYAFGVWLYRLIVFFGIAFMVYHFFVKMVGIGLALIEIVWFIGLPIKKEIMTWYAKRDAMRWNRHSIMSVAVAGLLLLVLFVPWRGYTLAPAVIRPGMFTELYPPASGRLEQIHVMENSVAAKGTPLFTIVSPQLAHEMDLALKEIQVSEAMLQRATSDLLRDQREVAIEQNIKARQQYLGLKSRVEQLRMTAPFDGVMVRLADGLKPGVWIGETSSLGMLAARGSAVVHAYADAETVRLLEPGGKGLFYADNDRGRPVEMIINQIGAVRTESLTEPMLASVHGGPIEVEERQGILKPLESVFLLQLAVADDAYDPTLIRKGHVRLKARPSSYAARMWRNLHSLFIRESGF